MYLMGVLILVAVVYFYLSSKKETAKPRNEKVSNKSSGGGKGFLPPIPAGYQIFVQNINVAGLNHRKVEAMKFAKSSNQELTLQKDPNNEFDKNAIKLIGVSGTNQFFIGYLPKEVAAQIAETEMFEKVKARLARIYIGSNGFLDIEYQVIGLKVDKKKFDEFFNSQLAFSTQKLYFKFFNLSIPRGLTTAQAKQIIDDHKKSSNQEEQKECDGYISILEEFDDKDFRDCYDLKKVSQIVLLEALNKLKAEGKKFAYLSDNIEEVVDSVLELKPDLER